MVADIRFYSPGEIAKIVNVSAVTVRNMIRARELAAVRVGRQWRVSESELRRLLRTGSAEAPAANVRA